MRRREKQCVSFFKIIVATIVALTCCFSTFVATKPMIIPRSQFAKDCNLPNNTLTIHAKRGKLYINSFRCAACEGKKKCCLSCSEKEYLNLDYRTEDGFYINLDFYKRFAKNEIVPNTRPRQKTTNLPSVPNIITKTSKDDTETDVEVKTELTEMSSEDRLKRAATFATLQNKKAATRLLNLQEAKLRNELIPTDIVKEMIQVLAESVKRSYADAGENMILWISERLSAQEHDKAAMRSKLLNSINKAVDDSVDAAQGRMEDLMTLTSEDENINSES